MPNCPPPPPVALTAIGVVLCTGLIGVVLLGPSNWSSPVNIAVIGWLISSYTLSGLVAWRRRPGSSIGPLMVLTGLCVLVSSLNRVDNDIVHTIGLTADLVPFVLIMQLAFTFPTGRLRGWAERLLIWVGYLGAVGLHLAVMLLGGLQPQRFTVLDRPGLAALLNNVELCTVSGVALAAVAVLIVRRRRDGRPLRRSSSLFIDSFMVGLVMIAVLLLAFGFGGPRLVVVHPVGLALLGVAPIAYLAGLLQATLVRSTFGDLVMQLRGDPAELRALLAGALRDPSLMLLCWLPEFGVWTDEAGRPVALSDDPTKVTLIDDDDGRSVAALVHDPALNDEPALLDAVSAAAAIALRNGRLQAQLLANAEELRGSRARIVAAEQRERQRLERDLHDGAQQRLLALSLNLGLLQTRVGGDPAATALLSAARTEIAVSLTELRDLAHGLYPAALTAHGLEVALESLAARGPVPVRLRVDMDGRVAEAIEIAAYYVTCESLANVGKHAGATAATVSVRQPDGWTVIEVADDGVGGADSECGTGLRGLADRVETLGGRFQVRTPAGGGTLVLAEFPRG
jgi:signal transduction histidine kinase